MRIAIAATPAIAIPALESLSRQHHIIFVVTQSDKAQGRGRQILPSEVAQWASQRSIEVLKPERFIELEDRLVEVDLVITIAYGQIIPERVLNVPRYGFINLHYSLLPQWRGAAPVQRALMAGDKKSGVTVFALDKGMDTGPIYVQKEVVIAREWRSKELFEELNRVGVIALQECVEKIESGATPYVQVGEPSFAPKIEKSENHLALEKPASTLFNEIRGLYPNAYFNFKESRIKVTTAHEGSSSIGKCGEVIELQPLRIVCGENSSLIITSVIPEGKREMSSEEWLRGARLTIGEIFG